jgi:hypothetical protein
MSLNIIFKRLKRLINHYFWHDRLIFINFVLALTTNLFFWIFLFLKSSQLEEIIPLHYNVYFGIDMIGSRHELLKMPALGLLILLINLVLAFRIYKHERVSAYFLLFANSLVQIFLLIAGFLIINL